MFFSMPVITPCSVPFSEVIEGKGHEDIYASAREEIYRIRKGAGGNRRCWTAKRTIREASTPSSSVDSPTRDLRKAGQRVWVCSGNRVIISVPSLCVCTKMFWREQERTVHDSASDIIITILKLRDFDFLSLSLSFNGTSSSYSLSPKILFYRTEKTSQKDSSGRKRESHTSLVSVIAERTFPIGQLKETETLELSKCLIRVWMPFRLQSSRLHVVVNSSNYAIYVIVNHGEM